MSDWRAKTQRRKEIVKSDGRKEAMIICFSFKVGMNLVDILLKYII